MPVISGWSLIYFSELLIISGLIVLVIAGELYPACNSTGSFYKILVSKLFIGHKLVSYPVKEL